MDPGMRIVFFGMRGRFSRIPLERLLEAGANVVAVITPQVQPISGKFPRLIEPAAIPASDLLILNSHLRPTIVDVASAHQIPLWEVDSLSRPETVTLLTDQQPDLIAVACFPYIFPKPILQLPTYGCVNLHPSLLPAYRGPAPLFWIARSNERETGVTLHLLDEGLDTGDIVAQRRFLRPDGISGVELEQRCAKAGAALLVSAVQQLAQGQPLPHHPQSQQEAAYFPWPAEKDLIIPAHWSARRAFNFLRGAENWPLKIRLDDKLFVIRVAMSYSADHFLSEPFKLVGDKLWVQFQPGVLRAKVSLQNIFPGRDRFE